MITKKKKNLKPIDIDVSFKYECPNTDCLSSHWLFLREVKTKNFKVVCHCGTVFSPKKIKNITLNYSKSSKGIISKSSIPQELYDNCAEFLMNYGFSDIEIKSIITNGYKKNPENNIYLFKKFIIQNLGELTQ